MSTLLMRFAGPMQSWGTDSWFDIRKTNREPTKSGVIGLLAAALGLKRDEPLDALAALRFGVRVDREGVLTRDFHMVRGAKSSYVTTRYYLCDAVFLVGVQSEDEALMQRLDEAVRYPAFPLFLGRRSCPPEGRVRLGLREKTLEEALRQEPSLIAGRSGAQPPRVRIQTDEFAENGQMGTAGGSAAAADVRVKHGRQNDLPVSFSPYNRQYSYRAVQETMYRLNTNEHDPMRELR